MLYIVISSQPDFIEHYRLKHTFVCLFVCIFVGLFVCVFIYLFILFFLSFVLFGQLLGSFWINVVRVCQVWFNSYHGVHVPIDYEPLP